MIRAPKKPSLADRIAAKQQNVTQSISTSIAAAKAGAQAPEPVAEAIDVQIENALEHTPEPPAITRVSRRGGRSGLKKN